MVSITARPSPLVNAQETRKPPLSTKLGDLQPTVQLFIMLGFVLAIVGVIAAVAFLLPQSLTGVVTMP